MTDKGGPKDPKPGPTEIRRGGLRSLGGSVPRITRHLTGRRGFADAGLLLEWPRIVGEEIARRSRPLRLSFEDRRARRAGTLLLRTAPGFALELQHLAPLLIERINGYFGYQAVAKLAFRQGPLPAPRPRRDLSPPDLSPEAEAVLSRRLASVEDEELRAALARFGKAFLGRRPEVKS